MGGGRQEGWVGAWAVGGVGRGRGGRVKLTILSTSSCVNLLPMYDEVMVAAVSNCDL